MKKMPLLLLAILLIAAACLPAYAAEAEQGSAGYVTDLYGLLTDSSRQKLEAEASRISQRCSRGIYIIILDDYTRYGAGDLYTTAGDLYLAKGLGMGPYNDGILLLLSMDQRMAALITYDGSGQFVTAEGKDWLAPRYLKHFKEDSWYEGLLAYLEGCETLLEMAAKGKPMTWLTQPGVRLLGPAVSLALGFLVTLLGVQIQKWKLRSVFKATAAGEYMTLGNVNLVQSNDLFVNRITSKRKIEPNGSGNSGGSRKRDSRGFSGRTDRF